MLVVVFWALMLCSVLVGYISYLEVLVITYKVTQCHNPEDCSQ